MSHQRRTRRRKAPDGPDLATPQAAVPVPVPSRSVTARRASQLAGAGEPPLPRPPRPSWQRLRRYAMPALALAGAAALALGLYLLRPRPEPADPAAAQAGAATAGPGGAGAEATDPPVEVAARTPEQVDPDTPATVIMPDGSPHGDGLPVRQPPPPAPRPAAQAAAAAPGQAGDPAGGADVAAIQRHLAALAFEPGRTDGVLDEQTRAAIARFQQFAGRAVTGRPSPALERELAALVETTPR